MEEISEPQRELTNQKWPSSLRFSPFNIMSPTVPNETIEGTDMAYELKGKEREGRWSSFIFLVFTFGWVLMVSLYPCLFVCWISLHFLFLVCFSFLYYLCFLLNSILSFILFFHQLTLSFVSEIIPWVIDERLWEGMRLDLLSISCFFSFPIIYLCLFVSFLVFYGCRYWEKTWKRWKR